MSSRVERIWIGLAALSGAGATAADIAARHLLAAFPVRADYALIGARFGYAHALALLAIGLLSLQLAPQRRPWLAASGWCFALGQTLFSGSLYLSAASLAPWSGRLTVPGLILLFVGWLSLFMHALTLKPAK
jgi:uncharacterized membrane protein YgdD (TMEM256/DUF423 family)